MGAFQTALATLRRCSDALAADPDPAERARLLELHRAALELLEQGADRRRLSTRALAVRVAKLERQLAGLDPADRAAAIQSRLGIGRSRYYEVRRLALSPENAGLAAGTIRT